MKKKGILIAIPIIIIFTVLTVSIILYSKNNNGLIFNRKQKAISEKENITIIDVTGLIIGKETEHEHIYKTMYDDNEHWEQCTICGEKQNEASHNYQDSGWTAGTPDICDNTNLHIFTCKCGSKISDSFGRAEHNYYGYVNDPYNYSYLTWCVDCGYGVVDHRCKIRNRLITCKYLGQCTICGYNYTQEEHVFKSNKKGNLNCEYCGVNLGTVTEFYVKRINDMKVRAEWRIKLNSGSEIGEWMTTLFNWPLEWTDGDAILEEDEFILYDEYDLLEKTSQKCAYNWDFRVYTANGQGKLEIYELESYADSEPPEINNIYISDNSISEEWARNKTITIEGTENWTNTVTVDIFDDREISIYTGRANVTDGNYSISCIPEIEADDIGKEFTVRVTDTCNNTSEKKFIISKIDGMAPEPTSGNIIGGDWSREKDFTFSATDNGIGNVQIGFNDVADYKLATKNENEYSRNYKFVGDVYSPLDANVYYKDELGNVITQTVTIDKLDNTAPTITSASFSNNKLNIVSNDVKSGLGEGSGVSKYRYLASPEKLEKPLLTLDNSIEVSKDTEIKISDFYKVKYVYIVAEDAVRKYK